MGGVSGTCGPKGPQSSHTNVSQADVATVKQGETTLRQVAQRLGVSEDALRKANPHIKDPNQLKVGQDICLPEQSKAKAKEDSGTSKTNKAPDERPKSDGGFKVPSYKKGNWEIKPTVTGSTSSIADGEGSTQARREQRDRLDGTRRRDDRDMTPKEIAKEKERAKESARKAADPLMKDIHKNMPEGKGQREVGNAKERELRNELLRREQQRLRPNSPKPNSPDTTHPQNAPTHGKDQK